MTTVDESKASPPPAGATPAPRERVRVNAMHMYCGVQGAGKTTLMQQHDREWLQKGRWLFVHDPNGDWGALCATYRTTAEWKRRIAECERKRTPMPRGAAFSMTSPTDMTKLVIELSDRHNTQHHAAMPMRVNYDETVLMEKTSATYVDPLDLEVAIRRRHRGLEPCYNNCDPALIHPKIWAYCTDVWIFAQSSEDYIETLRKRCGAPRGVLERMMNAAPHGCLHWKRGAGGGFV